jgi:hypothetical protein
MLASALVRVERCHGRLWKPATRVLNRAIAKSFVVHDGLVEDLSLRRYAEGIGHLLGTHVPADPEALVALWGT